MKIKDLMKKPIVIEHDMMLSDAAKLMTKYSISSLLIVNDGEVLGIITYHDLVRNFGESKKVSEVMTRKVVSVKEGDKLQSAIEIWREKEIGVFPVLNSKGKLVGILDSKDILKSWDNEDYIID